MQLRFTPPLVVRTFGANFNQGLFATFTCLATIGTCSAVIFNSSQAQQSLGNAFDPLKKAFEASILSSGLINLGNTFKSWGESIFNSKDEFIDWLGRYFDVNGLKSGVAELYGKLKVWVEIVYNWFATKFLKFIENIPQMVKDWKKLRLSLFKWGTFLGGGGGSALWAMFGTGDNWDKLGELMGHPNFEDMMNDFNKLVQDNEEAFKDMGSEGIQDILQKYLDNPEEAQKAAKELLEEQEKKKEENKKDSEKKEEEKSDELSTQEISEKFNPQKGGNPETPGQVFSNMVQHSLKGLVDLPYSLFGVSSNLIKEKAEAGMKEYLANIENDVKTRKNKSSEVKKQFLDILSNEEERKQFIDALAKAAMKAYQGITNKKPDIETLTDEFVKGLEGSVTEICKDENNCESVDLSETLKKQG
ncbi:hypothetical protein A6V39_00605 [Candidatus Mycoplasma haematobovis]|uniref:Uncharacterized protein n=1 Tax=Candidatus Mycoplasma haematobovis TaxID=432608 RepID=A0A1A9QEW6_9MOLU|nr:hypothetical protein [Candidatus Mycoplasma haematobovis]OAL10551.1 hypothetical protein A6V39_00605 [Candidatus Mycoplasma haematobovis]